MAVSGLAPACRSCQPMMRNAVFDSCCMRQASSAVAADSLTKTRLETAASVTISPMAMPTSTSTSDSPCCCKGADGFDDGIGFMASGTRGGR